MVGWRETREVWPALAVSGLSFAGMQFYWSNYQESGLVDIIAALFSLLMMVAFLKVWRPRTILENPASARWTRTRSHPRSTPTRRHSAWAVLKGWSPFLLASVLIFVWAQPQVARYLTVGCRSSSRCRRLHQRGRARAAGGAGADGRGRDRRPEHRLAAGDGRAAGRGPGGA